MESDGMILYKTLPDNQPGNEVAKHEERALWLFALFLVFSIVYFLSSSAYFMFLCPILLGCSLSFGMVSRGLKKNAEEELIHAMSKSGLLFIEMDKEEQFLATIFRAGEQEMRRGRIERQKGRIEIWIERSPALA